MLKIAQAIDGKEIKTMKKQIKNNVGWVGKVDWELKQFHGNEFSTNHGSTYNAYLVQEEKTVLIDTVWKPYDKEFVANLSKEIDLSTIDFVVANHGEVDHSGSQRFTAGIAGANSRCSDLLYRKCR